MVWEFAPPGFHSSDAPFRKDSRYERRRRIVSDPALAEILAAIAGEITWQRLRVAFEKICAVVSQSTTTGKWDNAMVKHAYASQDELIKFKENVQDRGTADRCGSWGSRQIAPKVYENDRKGVRICGAC
jgi:hypothetical protein